MPEGKQILGREPDRAVRVVVAVSELSCGWRGEQDVLARGRRIGTKLQHVKGEKCVQSCWRLWLFNHNFVPSGARRPMELLPTEVKQMVYSTHLVNYPPCEEKVRMLTNHI